MSIALIDDEMKYIYKKPTTIISNANVWFNFKLLNYQMCLFKQSNKITIRSGNWHLHLMHFNHKKRLNKFEYYRRKIIYWFYYFSISQNFKNVNKNNGEKGKKTFKTYFRSFYGNNQYIIKFNQILCAFALIFAF